MRDGQADEVSESPTKGYHWVVLVLSSLRINAQSPFCLNRRITITLSINIYLQVLAPKGAPEMQMLCVCLSVCLCHYALKILRRRRDKGDPLSEPKH